MINNVKSFTTLWKMYKKTQETFSLFLIVGPEIVLTFLLLQAGN